MEMLSLLERRTHERFHTTSHILPVAAKTVRTLLDGAICLLLYPSEKGDERERRINHIAYGGVIGVYRLLLVKYLSTNMQQSCDGER